MELQHNISLRSFHTFATEAKARYFLEFSEPEDLRGLWRAHPELFEKVLIVGGGSNLLFTGDFGGMVIRPAVAGIAVEKEDADHVWLRAGAGVLWDDFVRFAVERGWGGVENLSLIPARVGAVPVQNIGAYGCEVAEAISQVAGMELTSGNFREFDAVECRFSYRSSLFKEVLKNRFVITSVVFQLDKEPRLKLEYSELKMEVMKDFKGSKASSFKDSPVAEVAEDGISLQQVRDAVIRIRTRKLPDPAELGNAGSFFKNPVVAGEVAKRLKAAFPALPLYPGETRVPGKGETPVKLSAGWLIDQCGWKGFRRGDAGVHHDHALVLVNYGQATGREIFQLAEEIRLSVKERFGVDLEREVIVV